MHGNGTKVSVHGLSLAATSGQLLWLKTIGVAVKVRMGVFTNISLLYTYHIAIIWLGHFIDPHALAESQTLCQI